MASEIDIGGVRYKLISSPPSSRPYLEFRNGNTVLYGVLSQSKPSTRTLMVSAGGTVRYLNQPNKFIGVVNSPIQGLLECGGISSPRHLYMTDEWRYDLGGNAGGTVIVMANAAYYSRVGRNCSGDTCGSGDCYPESSSCPGSDRSRSMRSARPSNMDELIDSYEKIISVKDEVENDIPYNVLSYPVTRAVSVSPPACDDTKNGNPNGGVLDRKNWGYGPMPSVTAIAEWMFDPSASASNVVHFKYSNAFYNIPTYFVTMFFHYFYRHSDSCHEWFDYCHITGEFKIRREGTAVIIQRTVHVSVDQALSTYRYQQWYNNFNSSVGVYQQM